MQKNLCGGATCAKNELQFTCKHETVELLSCFRPRFQLYFNSHTSQTQKSLIMDANCINCAVQRCTGIGRRFRPNLSSDFPKSLNKIVNQKCNI